MSILLTKGLLRTNKKRTIDEFKEIASNIHKNIYNYDKSKYITNRTKIEIKCIKCNYNFEQRPTDHISKKYGCPNCKKSRSELCAINIVKNLMIENKISGEFKPATPKMVKFLNGLYLDGCHFIDNKIGKFAIEYQGIQHYEYPNIFHKTREQFDKQVENDIKKVKLCKENNLDLIVIPHKYSYRNEDDMKNFIKEKFISITF